MSPLSTTAAAPLTTGFFADYRPPAEVFDEMQAAGGAVRPHWQELARRLERLGAEGLRERRENVRGLLREHGVTYNVFAEGRSAERRWELGTLPLIIAAEEWARLVPGLIQRTRLLNLVLADIYGPQRLLREGVLPPALLQANPGFLRPCHGMQVPRGIFLSLHAIDLTRAPDGRWWVLTDRTQAPSGLGYALENRSIVSRVLPEEFRACRVERTAAFFAERRAGLQAMAPWTETPNIVLLTPGPLSETYFEHAYLARQFGLPLVEGGDLTVRDRSVFLKTLDGLQRVDVIVRRVDDTYCDPLELRGDSFLGVPGLVEAARAGRVAISNALGSGAVESPAILAFLPKLARHLLDEELQIPNVATWWCGQEAARESTLRGLGTRVVKRSFVGHAEPAFGAGLSAEAREKLAARIRANPENYVGQERVALSTVPLWTGERLEPRPLILRCYVCATVDGFAVMPGGLTRVSATPDSPVVSSQHGGASMDTWVLSAGPVESVPMVETSAATASFERGHAAVPSRVVENLFWLGRYAERLEDTTRLLRTALGRLAGEGGPGDERELAALARWLVVTETLPERFGKKFTPGELAAALRDLVFAREEPGSVRAQLARVGFLIASVRDRLSGDTWRILNQMQLEFPTTIRRATPGSIVAALHRLIIQLAAFSGMEMENMTRGPAWRFLAVGRRLERAINVATNVRAVLATDPARIDALPPLLEYTDSTMTYRRRHFAQPELPATLDLLLADVSNPRSLAFQCRAISRHCDELPAANGTRPDFAPFLQVVARLTVANIPALGEAARSGEPARLEALLGEIIDGCSALSELLGATYFSHVIPRLS
ncbi:MAG: circularly permuted type 2 ATP-grasp protein [Chthoniobacter sp.]|nr:circularly permuted type 2 ATP-grasp protein [Chthoniobacter sp.]